METSRQTCANYDENWLHSVLVDLGYRPKEDGQGWRFAASFRGGSNQGSIFMFKNSGWWTDYGLGDDEYHPLDELLRQTIGEKAAERIMGGATVSHSRVTRPSTLLKMPKVYDPSCLKRLIPHKQFFLKRKISPELLDKMQSGYSAGGGGENGKFYQRYVFPLFNELGQIGGFAGRHVFWNEEMAIPKWKIVGSKGDMVWPLYVPTFPECAEAIISTKQVYLVESVGDSLALIESELPNNFVLFGLAVSPKSVAEMIRLGVERISLCLNKDETENGQIASCKAILKLLKHFPLSKLEIKIPTKNDIGTMFSWGEDIKAWSQEDGLRGEEIIKYVRSYEDKLPKKHRGLINKYE